MSISEQAFEALRAAVTWNPIGARNFLDILREYPDWVKYKNDPYGPLHLLLIPGQHRRQITKGVSVPIKSPPFPQEKLPACEVFGREWLQRKFSKQELADMIESILREIDAQA
jgi:hypothetical protein